MFAGEVSGHYYFGEFYGVDTGILPALLVLQLVSRSGTTLHELLRPELRRWIELRLAAQLVAPLAPRAIARGACVVGGRG